jgi:hypothetical protein
LPLAKIVPFYSTPIWRRLISVSAFNFCVEKDWARRGVRFHQPPPVSQSPQGRSHNLAFSLAEISPTPL